MSYEEVLPLSHQHRWFASDKSSSDSPQRLERQNQLQVGKSAQPADQLTGYSRSRLQTKGPSRNETPWLYVGQ